MFRRRFKVLFAVALTGLLGQGLQAKYLDQKFNLANFSDGFSLRAFSLNQTNYPPFPATDSLSTMVTELRTRYFMNWQPREWFKLRFVPQFRLNYNMDGDSPYVDTGSNFSDVKIRLHELWFELALWDALTLRLGRQEISWGNGTMIGNGDWLNEDRSFDAVLARYAWSFHWIELFYAKLGLEKRLETQTMGDESRLIGLNMSFHTDAINDIELFAFDQQSDKEKTDGKLNRNSTFGAHVRAEPEKFVIELTGAAQHNYDRSVDKFESLFSAELWRRLEYAEGLKLGMQYDMASAFYDQLYPNSIWSYGETNFFGQRNLSDIALNAVYTLSDAVTMRFIVHNYSRNDVTAGVDLVNFNNTSSLPPGTAADPESSDIGREISFSTRYRFPKRWVLVGTYSYFAPGEYFKMTGGNDPVHSLWLVGSAQF